MIRSNYHGSITYWGIFQISKSTTIMAKLKERLQACLYKYVEDRVKSI
uniref:Uncharacterized protein n=1 Tax=Rhizophora mucronata TaxID=61149 RepID=A0A2P2JH88_RHIMU